MTHTSRADHLRVTPAPRRRAAVAAVLALVASVLVLAAGAALAAAVVRPIVFPLTGTPTWTDTFGACRDGCSRPHEGQDIMVPKMRPLLAAVDGTVSRLTRAASGNSIVIRDAEGWTYHYIHVNNDTPGTDHAAGSELEAFAPGMRVGARVLAGQVIAYAGDSGNAESAGSHLHFEIREPGGAAVNPADSLRAASSTQLDEAAHLAANGPFGNLDILQASAGRLRVVGWAVDRTDLAGTSVHVYANGNRIGAVASTVTRDDVRGAVGGGSGPNAFDATMDVPNGTTSVCVYGIDGQAGPAGIIGCRTIAATTGGSGTTTTTTTPPSTTTTTRPTTTTTTRPTTTTTARPTTTTRPTTATTARPPATAAPSSTPFGNVDGVRRIPGGLAVFGWAIDPNTTGPIDVHVYADTTGVAGRAGRERTDVGAAFPAFGAGHGFEVSVPAAAGNRNVCVYAINVGAGTNKTLSCRTVAVSSTPFGSLDAVDVLAGAVLARGWTIDPDVAHATDVHVYVDGVGVGMLSADLRPDVAAAYPGYGPTRGFSRVIPATPGRHQVCAFAIGAPGTPGGNAALGCRDVTVPA